MAGAADEQVCGRSFHDSLRDHLNKGQKRGEGPGRSPWASSSQAMTEAGGLKVPRKPSEDSYGLSASALDGGNVRKIVTKEKGVPPPENLNQAGQGRTRVRPWLGTRTPLKSSLRNYQIVKILRDEDSGALAQDHQLRLVSARQVPSTALHGLRAEPRSLRSATRKRTMWSTCESNSGKRSKGNS